MKKLLFSSVIVLFHLVANAQYGIFKTYEDYLNNKVDVEYPGFSYTGHVFGKFKVEFIDEAGEKVEFDVDRNKMWGFRGREGHVYRVDEENDPYMIITSGKIVLYGNFTTQILEEYIVMRDNQWRPQISLGQDGEMIKLKKKNLKKLLKEDEAALLKLKKSKRHFEGLMEFIKEYNNTH